MLTVVHLLYSTGYAAPAGDELMRTDLAESSLDLARMLHGLLVGHREVTGLLALIHYRRPARRPGRRGRRDPVRRAGPGALGCKIGEGTALVREALGPVPRAVSP